jgi:hypothetical protein
MTKLWTGRREEAGRFGVVVSKWLDLCPLSQRLNALPQLQGDPLSSPFAMLVII